MSPQSAQLCSLFESSWAGSVYGQQISPLPQPAITVTAFSTVTDYTAWCMQQKGANILPIITTQPRTDPYSNTQPHTARPMDFCCTSVPPHHHHITTTTTTTVLQPFFRDHPGEPVLEENFWTSWCKGRLTEADTHTIRLGDTPSGLTSAHLHHHITTQQITNHLANLPYMHWQHFVRSGARTNNTV